MRWRRGGDGFFYFGGGVARGDVFGAVPVVGNYIDEEDAFDDALDFGFGEFFHEFGMFAGVLGARVAEDLESGLVGIIHEEERHAVIGREVACGEHENLRIQKSGAPSIPYIDVTHAIDDFKHAKTMWCLVVVVVVKRSFFKMQPNC